MLCRKSLSLVKELIESCLVEADGSIQLHAAKVVTNVVTILLVKFIKHNQNYYLKLDVSTSIRAIHQKKREPCHQLVSSDGDRQRARAFYQMDQGRHTHPKGRTTTVMRSATNWATHTTAFLTRHLPVVSRTGRTVYQLLLMKASDRGRNVKL